MVTMPKSSDVIPRVKRMAGRPVLTDQDRERSRQKVLQGAAGVYGNVDYKSLRVDDLIQASGISRPTFYSLFSNKEEVLELLVRQANDTLLQGVVDAVAHAQNPEQQLMLALRAYVEWGCNAGPVVLAIYREARIEGSPAYAPRAHMLQALGQLLQEHAGLAGYSPPVALVEACCIAIEHLGSQLFAAESISPELKDQTLQHMHRVASVLFPESDLCAPHAI